MSSTPSFDAQLSPVSSARVARMDRRRRRLTDSRLSLVGVTLLLALVVLVLVGPLIWTQSAYDQDLLNRVAAPSAAHPLGTDLQGRDMLARLLVGGRTSLFIAVTAVFAAGFVGVTIGLVAGYLRGPVDAVLMRVMDVVLSFPSLLLALIIAASRGPGVGNTILAVSVPTVPSFARLARSMVLSVRERDYVLAARAAGATHTRIVLRHVVPNSISPVIVQTTLALGIVLLEVAGLGFLGIGVQPPSPEWGAILFDARTYLLERPELVIAPGLVLTIAVLGFNLLGDLLGDRLEGQR